MIGEPRATPAPAARDRLRRALDVAIVFLRIGITGFGGPAALISMTQDEVVQRRKWLTREHFLDIVGITNLIPGPNATEIALMVGHWRAGWPGLLIAGAAIIGPAAIISGLFGWVYVRWGALPQVAPLFSGIKPVVVVVVLAAVWRLAGTVTRDWRLGAIAVATGLASLGRGNEIAALLLGGVLGALWLHISNERRRAAGATLAALFAVPVLNAVLANTALAAALGEQIRHVSLWDLSLFFAKIGSVLYGGGYVLVSFLEGGLVRDLGWLTQPQLLDAIAVGQFTPGPLLSTASFIGYVLGGAPGAILATLAVFGPGFVFVSLLAPWLPRLRQMRWASLFLDAVGAASIGLMAAVVLNLGRAALTSPAAWLIAAGAAWGGIRLKLNFSILIMGGAVVGWLLWAAGVSL